MFKYAMNKLSSLSRKQRHVSSRYFSLIMVRCNIDSISCSNVKYWGDKTCHSRASYHIVYTLFQLWIVFQVKCKHRFSRVNCLFCVCRDHKILGLMKNAFLLILKFWLTLSCWSCKYNNSTCYIKRKFCISRLTTKIRCNLWFAFDLLWLCK